MQVRARNGWRLYVRVLDRSACSQPRELTFIAGLHALAKTVFHVFIPGFSAFLVPSTARSATTDLAGFLELAALWARHRMSDRC